MRVILAHEMMAFGDNAGSQMKYYIKTSTACLVPRALASDSSEQVSAVMSSTISKSERFCGSQ